MKSTTTKLFARSNRRHRNRKSARGRGGIGQYLACEPLEDRRLLATLTTELISGTDGAGSTGDSYSTYPSISDNGQFVAFRSPASDLVAGDTNNRFDVFVRDVANGSTTLVSTDSGGTQGNYNSLDPSISDDGRYVAFRSQSTNLVAGDTDTLYDVYVKDLQSGGITLASVSTAGVKSNSSSYEPSISGDGRYVAFRSGATNLDPGDTDGINDIFVRDLVNNTTTLVSTSSSGVKSNNSSYEPSISDDGRYVSFSTFANNLVTGDTNGRYDVFVKDLQIGTTTRVSTDSSGNQGNYDSYQPSISGDGRYVTFYSGATNLDPGDTDGIYDIFVRDLVNNTTTLVSTSSSGVKSNNSSYEPSISDDGRYVSFYSFANNLVTGDTNSRYDVFIKDLQIGTTTLVSTDSSGNQANNDSFETNAALSGNGQHVAFYSRATNLGGDDFNNTDDVFVRDLVNATTTLVSERDPDIDVPGNNFSFTNADIAVAEGGRFVAFETRATNLFSDSNGNTSDVVVRDREDGSLIVANTSSSGVQGNGWSSSPSISDDGRYVAFISQSTNLVAGDTDTLQDVYVKDLQSGGITLASVSTAGVKSNSSSYEPSISGDGRYVAFRSRATNLDSGDTDGIYDIFVRDLVNNTTTLVSTSSSGVKSNNSSFEPSISDDGRYVSFSTFANNLVTGDTNSHYDVFIKDLQIGTTTLVSTDSSGNQGNYDSRQPSISGDGSYVAFISQSTNLVAGDTDMFYDVYVKDLQSGGITLASVSTAGVKSNGYSYEPSISDDGRYVAFRTNANNLVSGDTNGWYDVFVKDLQTHETTRVSNTESGGQSNGFSYRPSISGDGAYVAFTSRAPNLPGGNGYYQVYLSAPDNSPPVANDSAYDLAENGTNGTVVGTVVASDPNNDALTYTLLGGSGSAAFDLDTGTGEITVADSTLLDYETTTSFTLDVQVDDENGGSDTARITIDLLNQASISGVVYIDVNQNESFDANEPGLDGVTVELRDGSGTPVLDDTGSAITAVTSDGGFYLFEDLDPGDYQLFEVQPTGVTDGAEELGTLMGTIVANDTMQLMLDRTDAFDYAFAEIGQQVAAGDTATIGFWHNKHGQALIAEGDTALANWLTNNFGNVFGNTFDGASGDDVADFFRNQLFKQKGKKNAGPAKVDAQFMAVAFATYFTSNNLAGNVASSYGFNVTDTGIGTNVVNVGANGLAFDVADNTDLTILQLLQATNAMTDIPDNQNGSASIYDQNGDGHIDEDEAALRAMANQVFSMINEGGDI